MSEESNSNRLQSTQALLTNELFEHCNSESISEEVPLRELVDRHRLTHNNIHVDNYGFFFTACNNERVTEGIIRFLLECFPDAASAADENGRSPLHCACGNNPNMTPGIIHLLINANPDSLRSVNNKGSTPLIALCVTKTRDDVAAIEILKLLLDKYPEAVRHAPYHGNLPIHIASMRRSPEFCRMLIEAYPGSERITDPNGSLPLHYACAQNSLATVEYVYKLFPGAIDHVDTDGYPIHDAIRCIQRRYNPIDAVKVLQFLLDCDPNQKLIHHQGKSLLDFACWEEYNDSNIEAGIKIIKILFDAYPEAIEDNEIAPDLRDYHRRAQAFFDRINPNIHRQQVQAFINSELVYARQAKDHILMTALDENGRLHLHTALQNNVRLGSIKLLVNGNPAAVQSPDNSGALPLHIACQHHDSASVVHYLISLDEAALKAVDFDNNTALHYACRGAKHDTIALLLEKYDAASVSKRNADDKLPIELLWESNVVSDRESVEYMGSVFQLVRANPEMVAIGNSTVNQPVDVYATRYGKKRKCSHDHEE